MSQKSQTWSSTIGLKMLMALTGLMWAGFLVMHLIGNTLLFSSSKMPFNVYGAKLASLGPLLAVAEGVLALALLVHFLAAWKLTLLSRKARKVPVSMVQSKGGPTQISWGGSHMLLTGMLLVWFVCFHVGSLSLGPGLQEGYVALDPEGKPIRDLALLVYQHFAYMPVVLFYSLVLLAVGAHLSHGLWSAAQTLGLSRQSCQSRLRLMGRAFGLVLCLGFLMIPWWVHFAFKHVSQGGVQ
jgi:succinate dehydrogenase / fumarate reductase, cytochrome b subunit